VSRHFVGGLQLLIPIPQVSNKHKINYAEQGEVKKREENRKKKRRKSQKKEKKIAKKREENRKKKRRKSQKNYATFLTVCQPKQFFP